MRWFVRLALGVTVLAAAGTGGLLFWAHQQPKPELISPSIQWSQVTLDREGRLLHLALTKDGFYRLPVKTEALSREAIDATLRYEDKYFYDHPGINPFSVVRAAWATAMGPRKIGASTLTMQVARRLQKLDTRTWRGKISQMLWALRYDAHYSKDEILSAYLSLAPYGGNIEGIEAASLIYFGKHASQLSTAEAVALSVIPQNPVKRHPHTGKDFDKARIAAGERALKAGFIHPRLSPVITGPLEVKSRSGLPFFAPHFVRYVEMTTPDQTLKTTLSLSLNQSLEKLLKSTVARLKPYGVPNGALMVVDTRDMSVLAHVGSADFFDSKIAGEVDGTLAPRSPGSTLKPFIYGLALDQGLIHSQTLLMDEPRDFHGYQPGNSDKRYRGPLHATDALNESRNVPAVTLAGELKPDLYAFLNQAGVQLTHSREHYGLSIVLGGAEVTMTNLAELYSMLAGQGLWRPVVRSEADVAMATRPLLSPEAAWIVRRMLADGGETIRVNGLEVPLLWKTGTSNGYRDAWTAGLAGHYAIVVWLGNFNGHPGPWLQGSLVAQPLFKSIAMRVLTDRQFAMTNDDIKAFWARPALVSEEDVCRSTGDLATDHEGRTRCTDTMKAWFIPGRSPIRETGFLKPTLIDKKTGLRACIEGPNTEVKYLEQWPTEYQQRFLQAGVVKPKLPAWDPTCKKPTQVAGNAPKILSPRANTRYFTTGSDTPYAQILLRASTPPDATLVYWFADDRFIDVTPSGKSLVWRAAPGTHHLAAVDDLGRRTQRSIEVKQP